MSPESEVLSATQKKPSYRSLLTHGNYRLLLSSQVISAIGDGVYALALIWMMKIMTGSALLMSILLAAEIVPLILVGLFAGIIVDRGNKKKMMIWNDIFRGVIVSLLVLLWMVGWLEPYTLIVAAILLSTSTAFYAPSRMVSVRTIVPEDHMVQAQSLSQIAQTVVGLSAPAIGAWLIHMGISYAFIVNAASFFISSLLISLIRNEQLSHGSGKGTLNLNRMMSDFKEGLRTITSHPLLRSLVQYIVLINFMLAPTSLLFPLIVTDASELAVLETSFFIGIAVGALLINFMSAWPPVASLAFGIGLMLIGLGALYWDLGLYFAAMFVFVAGLGSPMANVTLQTLFILKVPRETLGRAGSMMKVLLEAARPTSMLLAGALITWIPLRSFFAVMALLGLIIVGLMVLNPAIRSDKEVQTAQPSGLEKS
ncbi:conserved membrane hypothetical protein [[Clostridium] ultunense Esp]|nr:conserved membrane hypothetical protein [[Clostridium] ultunense Esp]